MCVGRSIDRHVCVCKRDVMCNPITSHYRTNTPTQPQAAFILSDWLSAQSPDKEDGRAIIRTLMVNNFAPRVPCFVQLAEPHSIFQVSGCWCLGRFCTKDDTCIGPSQHVLTNTPYPHTPLHPPTNTTALPLPRKPRPLRRLPQDGHPGARGGQPGGACTVPLPLCGVVFLLSIHLCCLLYCFQYTQFNHLSL